MPKEAEVDDFVDQLTIEARQKRVSILDCEFLVAVEDGTATRPQIAAWGETFYEATRHGRLTIGNYYANSPDDPELRRELAENLYEEETGRISGVNRCHMDVFRDFLAALGVSDEDAPGRVATERDRAPLGHAIEPQDFYVELAAYGLSVETPNAEFCARMHAALRRNYGFTDTELTWFSMHAVLDSDHGDEFKHHARHLADVPDGLERLRDATLTLSRAVQQVWNGFGHWRAVN